MASVAFVFAIILCCFRMNSVVGQSIDLDKCYEVISRAVETAGSVNILKYRLLLFIIYHFVPIKWNFPFRSFREKRSEKKV